MPKGVYKHWHMKDKPGNFGIGHPAYKFWLGKKRKKFNKEWLEKIKKNLLVSHVKGERNPGWKDGRFAKDPLKYKRNYSRLQAHTRRHTEGKFNWEDWESVKKNHNFTCIICKKAEPEIKLTIDHIIPIARGGKNYIDNIQPPCRSCNAKKWIK